MKRKFKGLVLFLLLILLTSALSACSEESTVDDLSTVNNTGNESTEGIEDTTDGEVVTLKILHRWPQEPDVTFFKEVVEQYENDNPNVKIDIQAIANDPYKEKIKVILGTDEAPDVFFTWPGDFTNRFVRAEKIYDLTDDLAKDGWGDSYMEAQIQPFTYEGRTYGVPYRVNGKVFVYNKKIFDEIGVSAPENWEEFLVLCEEIKAYGITPIAYGNVAQWASTHYVGTLTQKEVPNDVRLNDYNPETGEFTHPGYAKALEKYKQIIAYSNPDTNSIKHAEARINFVNGKAAMMFVETMEFPTIENDSPEGFDYGVFKFPVIEGGEGNQNFITGYPEGFVISQNTKHPEEAIDFLKYLTGKEIGMKEASDLGFFNGAKGAITKEAVSEQAYIGTEIMLAAEGSANWMDAALESSLANLYMVNAQKLADDVITVSQFMKEVQELAKEVSEEMTDNN